eukprot:2586179-Lingulodinium_polyedra.AAC.1
MAGWTDLLGDAGPACVPSSGNPSRIDVVLTSRAAKAWVRSARARWDLGLAAHAALQVELDIDPPEA